MIGGLVLLAAIATVPLFDDPAMLHTWTLIVMFCVLGQSWNFIGGYAGYAAFGNVVFFGLGSYTVGIMLNGGHPFWLGLLVGLVIAVVFAFIIGLPILRLRGHYFAIATLGVAVAVSETIAARNIGGSGGLISVHPPTLSQLPLFFYGFLGLSAATLIATAFISRSKFGYALVAIRENEQAAEAMGIPSYWYKVAAFSLSAAPTAVAGGLYAYWATGFDPTTVFDSSYSVEMVLLAFLGGAGTILGPLIGGIFFEYMSYQFQVSGFTLHNSLLGLSIVIVTIFLPQGIIRLVQEFVRPAGRTGADDSYLLRFREGLRRVQRFILSNGV
jgi:branched-chain amino acid transport system permease protein